MTATETAQLDQVFGVSKDPVLSYVERESVDARFVSALAGTRHIIVYGSSKQGKTALIHRHVEAERRVVAHCSPNSGTDDIYRSLLRQLDVEITTETSEEVKKGSSGGIKAFFKAKLPFFVEAGGELAADRSRDSTKATTRKTVEFNLGLAQDVGELLQNVGKDRIFVVENFHYLAPAIQSQFAFDLRTFEEMSLRFVVLGVWRESNRLVQFNGDLQDRIVEIPVEPWEHQDFARVVEAGSPHLNIAIDPQIQHSMFEVAHGSIGVVQELCKKFCALNGILSTQEECVDLSSRELLDAAIREKVGEYSTRHTRSLEAIAAGSRTRRRTENTEALYLPFYLVKLVVSSAYETLKAGLERKQVQEGLKSMHPAPDHVRTSDVTGLLKRLGSLQLRLMIQPPLFDYDQGSRRLRIVDSTLYFFIDNSRPDEIMEEIPHPNPDEFDDY